ncbi:phosphoribosylamine--glycine ligase [Candidatus Sulfidibacterium hydrothermale]|uniref:phosphoribosylamine--glycine ligase n=1 Tax=Candidatus Sulfidibacterium hydrothermale TaxID=2875962 RepID=UPI001F0A6061|nr:phosphoribosylamine--glycine ligase [Candidatus Sulfidibacterium hydrothermale]UBM61585.1 phosphoribosylamine--glycine ligase [Candidatus Sulfidibacterium hydrothermale]
MNILILGSGGREHALAWKLAQSPEAKQIFIAPGNAGTALTGTNVPINPTDFEALKTFVIEKEVEMVVVGPEIPLINGISDFFKQDKLLHDIRVVGPGSKGAQLEGSKDFAKHFMKKYGIPTAAYATFTAETVKEGEKFLETLHPPYVLKADGPAAGKGVLILDNLDAAKTELQNMLLKAKFGKASGKVVIEEYLNGIELSVFILTDGKDYLLLPEAKDYKRIGMGDTGPNTGGMGSVSPVPFANEIFMQKVKEQIIEPTLQGLQEENIPYTGFIFFGLMNVNDNPYVIEYNCRMGDPEAESVIPRIKNDLLEVFDNLTQGKLSESNLEIDERYAASVMLVSEGYPGKYQTGKVIKGLDNLNNCIVYYAGTSRDVEHDQMKTSGGRVLAITAFGDTLKEALQNAYSNVEQINFEGKYYRQDLGFDLQ